MGTRVEYTNSLSAIIVAIDVVIGWGKTLEGLNFHTENKGKVRTDADGRVAAKSGIRVIWEMHAGRTKGVS